MKRDNLAIAWARLDRAYTDVAVLVHGIGSDSACAFAAEHAHAVADIRREWYDEAPRAAAFAALAARYEAQVRRAVVVGGVR